MLNLKVITLTSFAKSPDFEIVNLREMLQKFVYKVCGSGLRDTSQAQDDKNEGNLESRL